MDYGKISLEQHKKLKGKIGVTLKDNLDTKEKLSIYYTPGVAAVSSHLAKHPEETNKYTWTNNNVAVISDGSAVLGLGNIGPEGALPVMEGKSMLFKNFANIDAIPIVLDVHSAEEIIATVKAIAPSFGAINLEDIAAPQCFEIEEKLINDLDMPVMHDDQHGTAVVVLAGLINAAKITEKKIEDMKIVVVGSGAAGVAIIKLLNAYANPDIIAIDSKGIIHHERGDLNHTKIELLKMTNRKKVKGLLHDALVGTDVFIGVSQPGLLTEELIRLMNKDPIIFAMANPTPEIMPDLAHKAGARIVATGRSDFPNQVNNALAFPGIFRGALDNNVRKITTEHKIAAAEVIASLVENPTEDNIIPPVNNEYLVSSIAKIIV
ncbi:MAG: NADP-dependent malic enzyme [Candidatus Saccharibacteria bacterium]